MIKALDLAEKFKYALDNNWGYIYGTSGQKWTQSQQDESTREQTIKWGQKWVGHYVADCSGLFVWAFKKLGGEIYHGSNTIWKKYLSEKGTLKSGTKETGEVLKAGTAVFKTSGSDRHHIGLFVGNGEVIEAKGTYYGVVKSKVEDWDEWGELKDVDYENGQKDPDVPVPEEKKYATVNASAVALREKPNGYIILRVPEGGRVEIVDQDWTKVSYNGTTGYMMTKFLDVDPDGGDT